MMIMEKKTEYKKELTLDEALLMAAKDGLQLISIEDVRGCIYGRDVFYKDCYIFHNSFARHSFLLSSSEYITVNKITGEVSGFSCNDEG